MPTDVKKAIQEYGYVGTLANSIPELRKILLAMAAKNASVEEFTRAVQDTKWWKNSADKIKQNQILKATKPGEFAAQNILAVTFTTKAAAELAARLEDPARLDKARRGHRPRQSEQVRRVCDESRLG